MSPPPHHSQPPCPCVYMKTFTHLPQLCEMLCGKDIPNQRIHPVRVSVRVSNVSINLSHVCPSVSFHAFLLQTKCAGINPKTGTVRWFPVQPKLSPVCLRVPLIHALYINTNVKTKKEEVTIQARRILL